MSGILASKTEENAALHIGNHLNQDGGLEPSLPGAKPVLNTHNFEHSENGHRSKNLFLAPDPTNEKVRLEALKLYQIEFGTDETLDNLVRLAANICYTPIATISFVGAETLIHKANYCPVPLSTIREGSFCSWTILNADIFVIPDAATDARFANNVVIAGKHPVNFYAGFPLATPEGYLIGTLAVMDFKPRELSPGQLESLKTLALSVMAHLNVRRKNLELKRALSDRSRFERQLESHSNLIKQVEREKEHLSNINAQLEKQTNDNQEEFDSLADREARYALVVNSTNDGMWDWDLGINKITYCYRWKKMIGYAQEEVGNSLEEWFKRIHPQDIEMVEAEVTAHLLGLSPQFLCEHRIRHRDGKYRWILCRGMAVWDTSKESYRMAGSITDITDQKEAEEQLLHNAFHDALTGLPNRMLFMNKLKRSLTRVGEDEYMFAILFLDLDRFKVINDSLGHHIGDQLLIALAQRLETAIRPGDMVARLGGDEFAIILDRIKSVNDATQAAHRIQQEFTTPFKLSGHEVFVSASIGISHSLVPYTSPEEFIRNADIAMYRAKDQGRGGFELFDVGMQERASERLQLEIDLRRALSHDEFKIHYQPIISLENWRISGFEALIRWRRHPEGALISPLKFIPIAEETGLIIPIGQWVLYEACKQVREWQLQYPVDPPLSISVNLSGVQFSDPTLIESIKKVLSDTGLDASSLKIEITESAIIENIETATEILNRIKELGIKISLDDFGTGYSSLSYLHRFPIDTLKIDRSFITAMNMEKNAEIVSTILTLAKNLGMDVIAEGVETREQIIQLTGMKCEYVQGFMLSKPMDGESMSRLIEDTYQKGIGERYDEPIS